MSEKIVVPVLGESITEATVAKWLKKTGDAVEADEPIVELETDKVNLEVPSPISGVLSEINSKDGTVVEVGALLGSVSEKGSGTGKKEEIKKKEPQEKQEKMVHDLAMATTDFLGNGVSVPRDVVRANCNYVGEGYGLPTEQMINALKMLAQLEGLLFDPVYSGKGLAGLIDLTRQGYFDGMQNVVFLHTGGSAALFGYPNIFGLPGYN